MLTKAREGKLVEAFVSSADTLVAGYDMVDMLHTLVENCADLLGASAAGILLADEEGRLEVVASTNERSLLVELMQIGAGAGPCMESVATGHAVAVPDIHAIKPEWKEFREAALEQGFRSLQAVPLRLRSASVGSLNLFWDEHGALGKRDADVAQALANVATISILQERAVQESNVVRLQLQRALDSRIVIEQAKGVVSHQHKASMDEAFSLIRDYARNHHLPLAEVAADIVEHGLQL